VDAAAACPPALNYMGIYLRVEIPARAVCVWGVVGVAHFALAVGPGTCMSLL
jgi:hypothetical protein